MEITSQINNLDRHNLFQLAIENISDQIILTDKDAKILYVNPEIEHVTGYTPEEAIGTRAGELWGGVMSTEFYKEMWKVLLEYKSTYTGKLQNRKKDGTLYWAEVKISPVLDKHKRISYFVGIERDITVIKEIDRMKTEFISLASHQLRTPLAANKWLLEMLISGDFGELKQEIRNEIETINTTNERMISLVNSLLSISRLESGKLMVEPVETNLIEFINNISNEMLPKITEKNLSSEVFVDPKIGNVYVDPDLLRHAITNLISNAIKYSPDGEKIQVKLEDKDNEYVCYVKDNGIGIPKEQQNQIFKKFFRANNAVELIGEGNGLGLYLVKHAIEVMGGVIGFESEENKGTTFWFKLSKKGMKRHEGKLTISTA